ncbi:MAG TPA: hypothetical protein VGL45_20170 [Bradyrhizobium sp.]
MARNFGMHQPTKQQYRGSFWPILLIFSILIGAINIATHLHR